MGRNSTHLAALAAVVLIGAGPAAAMRTPLQPPAPTPEPYLSGDGRKRAQWKTETNKRGRNR